MVRDEGCAVPARLGLADGAWCRNAGSGKPDPPAVKGWSGRSPLLRVAYCAGLHDRQCWAERMVIHNV